MKVLILFNHSTLKTHKKGPIQQLFPSAEEVEL